MNAAAASPQWGKTDSFLALIFVGLCACMVALGCWQLMRAEEKRSMLAREAESAAAAAVPLQAVLPDIATAATHYTRVVLTGEWLPKQQLLWDNRIALGVAGYEVLTPFKLELKGY